MLAGRVLIHIPQDMFMDWEKSLGGFQAPWYKYDIYDNIEGRLSIKWVAVKHPRKQLQCFLGQCAKGNG